MIRLWLSKENGPPIREQLGAQLLLGIISGKLAPGERLPSVRELARHLNIHRNSVSAVYRDLDRRGWLQMRRGSGVYVAQRPSGGDLDSFVRAWVDQAASLGYSIPDLQAALARLSEARPQGRWLVLDPDAELARIIACEIAEATGLEVDSSGLDGLGESQFGGRFLLVNEGNAASVLRHCEGLELHRVGLKSVAEIVAGIQRPSAPVLIGLVSRSRSILAWASTLLSALGFGAESVLLRNATESGWAEGLGVCDMVAADAVAIGMLSQVRSRHMRFRIVSERSLADLCQRMTASKVAQAHEQETPSPHRIRV